MEPPAKLPSVSDAAATAAALVPVPTMGHDATRIDWNEAVYDPVVALKDNAAAVVHQLKGAPGIAELIKSGAAQYATEIRCPRSMYARSDTTSSHEQLINWADDPLRTDDLFLIPGIVATEDTQMRTSGLHKFVYGQHKFVDVPAGWWLARGPEFRFTPLLANLLRFVKDKDGRLGPGMMSVEESQSGDNPCFDVVMHPDVFSRCTDRDVQIAALVGAFSQLPKSTMAQGADNEQCQLAVALRAEFESNGVADWDSDEFDAAKAATAMEGFRMPTGRET